jgi:hypothetical protein
MADGTIAMMTTAQPASAGSSSPTQLTIGADGSFEVASQYGRILMDSTGIHLVSNGSSEVHLGPLAGLPAPLSAIGSHFTVSADMTSLESSIIASGPSANPNGGAPALANPTLAALQAINTTLEVLTVALNANAPFTTAVGVAMAPAMIALAAALTTATAAIPSQSTST